MVEYSKDGIGLGTELSEEHIEFLMDGGKRGMVVPGILKSTTSDASGSPAHSPTTTARKGLVIARLAADDKFIEYVGGGLQDPAIGVLMDTINLLDGAGTAQDAQVRIHVGGYYDQAKLYGLDAGGKVDMKALGAVFKEDILP